MRTASLPAQPVRAKRSSIASFLLLLIPILAAHTFSLADIPAGLYLDESSIGYNAISLIETGRDEHGVFLPTYPKSVGDYKNPVLVYTSAVILKVLGVSEFALRFTSFIFYLCALGFILLLVNRLTDYNPVIRLYTLAAFGFLPMFFTISRIAFEVITQLTWTSAGLLLIWIVFQQEDLKGGDLTAIICGFVLGAATYTYSTGRLLSFLGLGMLWVVYFKRDNFKKLTLLTTAFLTALIPFFIFTARNPGAITSRFSSVSYWGNDVPLADKLVIFLQNYTAYFSPRFLLFQGDPNLRHSTGFGGVIFITVFLLALIGLTGIVVKKRLDRFNIFLLASLLLSPVAAAMTSEGTPHALRSMTLGLYVLLFSCHGVNEILSIENRRARSFILAGISLLLLVEIAAYQADYFLAYPKRSVPAMGSKGFMPSLQFAIDKHPDKVIFFSKPRETYAVMQFYSLLADNPESIPLTWDNHIAPKPNQCIIYNIENERELDAYFGDFDEFDSGGVIKARCYSS